MGTKETMKDTARVLGRMYDGIEYRGFGQDRVEALARYAGVPVWNGLTNEFHPTQVLADLLTMMEHSDKPLSQVGLPTWATLATTWAIRCWWAQRRWAWTFARWRPPAYSPNQALVATALAIAKETGAQYCYHRRP